MQELVLYRPLSSMSRKVLVENDCVPFQPFWSFFGPWRLNGWPEVKYDALLQIEKKVGYGLLFRAALAPLILKLERLEEEKISK